MPRFNIEVDANDSPRQVRALAFMLHTYAEALDGAFDVQDAAVPVGTTPPVPSMPPVAVTAPAVPSAGAQAVAPSESIQTVPVSTANVVPFLGAPPAPVPTIPTFVTPVAPEAASAMLAAATAATSLPPIASVTGEFDSTGLPWDARIHAENKAKKGDGTWKIRRGMADNPLVAQVLAELRGQTKPGSRTYDQVDATVLGIPAPPATVPLPLAAVPPVSVAPVAPPAADSAPVAIPIPPAPVPPAPVATDPVSLFRAMMDKISAGLRARTLTQEQIQSAHMGHGLPQLQLAITQPDKIPLIEATLGLI